MATVTPPSTPRLLDQSHQRIRHPLERLRKYINTYVALEAVALIGILISLGIWGGLLLDYGFFKAFTLDWVQAMPWGVRAFLLAASLVGLTGAVLFLVLTRLFKEFGSAALALVLERRFPGVLGDRLITAVELASPKEAAKYGYSPELVAETIHEAADRVGQVPVQEVFNWGRLRSYGFVLAFLTFGLYLMSLASFCAARMGQQEGPALEGVSDFHEVATIWGERNLLLRNVIWPRRAHLEVLPFYAEEPHRQPRIARDTPAPPLRVRAWKYVLADRAAEEGWRPLRWQDLEDNKALLEGDVPAAPKDWEPRDPDGLTADEVELRLRAFPVRTEAGGAAREESLPAQYCIATPEGSLRPLMWSDLTKEKLGGLEVPALPGSWDPKANATRAVSGIGLGGFGALSTASRMLVDPKMISLSVDDVKKTFEGAEKANRISKELTAAIRAVLARLDRLGELRGALDRLDERAALRSMRRIMRKLKIPETVTLVYKGRRTTNTVTMTPVANNEFTGAFGELKETVSYYARGEDYITATRQLVVVDLPRLERLESEEERPAYLYYRPGKDGTMAELRGKRQKFQGVPVSLSGEATTLEVPSGTNVTLTGVSTKPLEAVKTTAAPKDVKNNKLGEVKLIDDTSFQLEVKDVRREQRFTFEFKDTDGVLGRRNVVITPRDDVAPRIREFNPDEVIRKVKEGYLVAVGCRLPFKARIRDDHGLARIRYGCKIIPADFLTEQKVRALFGVAAVPMLAPGFGTRLAGVGYLSALTRELALTAGDEASEEQYVEVPAFEEEMLTNKQDDGRQEVLEQGTVMSLLAARQKEPFRRLKDEFTLTPDRWTDADEDANEPRRWVRAQDQRARLGCDLPLWQLRYKGNPLRDPDESKQQRRYLIEVRLLVDDTYTEGEVDPKTRQPIPHTSPSSETFTIVVVPENELLSKIAEEEETKYRELLKLLKPLAENRDRLRDIAFELSSPGVQQAVLNAMMARCDTLDEALKGAHQDAKAVHQTYERIVREMRVNQVREDILAKVFKEITLPLRRVADTQFDRTIHSVRELRQALGNADVPLVRRGDSSRKYAQDARNQLNDLVNQINAILNKMQGLAEINALIKELHEIEKQEGELYNLVNKIRLRRLKELLQEDETKKDETKK